MLLDSCDELFAVVAVDWSATCDKSFFLVDGGVESRKDSSSCSEGASELSRSISEGPPMEKEENCSSTERLGLIISRAWLRLCSGLMDAREWCR